MKTIHVFCTLRITHDQYSELLNSESSLSIRDVVLETLENGERSDFALSDLLVQIPLPPKSE